MSDSALRRYARPYQLSRGRVVLPPVLTQRVYKLKATATIAMSLRGNCGHIWDAIADGDAHCFTVPRERNDKFGSGMFDRVARELVHDELGSLSQGLSMPAVQGVFNKVPNMAQCRRRAWELPVYLGKRERWWSRLDVAMGIAECLIVSDSVAALDNVGRIPTEQAQRKLREEPIPQLLQLQSSENLPLSPQHGDDLAVCVNGPILPHELTHWSCDELLKPTRVDGIARKQGLRDLICIEPCQPASDLRRLNVDAGLVQGDCK